MKAEIRRVQPGDENTLAYIQTESWKSAFSHILDSATLQRCTDIHRAAAMYRRLLENHTGNGYLLTLDGEAHCIAWWDAARDRDMDGWAEIICIHSLPGNWRKGYGSRMMERLLADIAAAGYSEVLLWVFTENTRARRFYEAHGFRAADRQKTGLGAAEICYTKRL